MKNQNRAEEILDLYEQLQTKRSPYESTWDEITDLVVPNRGNFRTDTIEYRPNLDLYDSTAQQANEYLAATLQSGLVNPETKWFELGFEDEELNLSDDLKFVMEERANAMYKVFSSAKTGFYTSISEMFLDLSAYGTACIETMYVPGKGIRYKSIHLSGIYIDVDSAGQVDTVFVKFKMTARQAAQMWGKDALGEKMIRALSEEPFRKFEIVRCVKPEEDYEKKKTTKFSQYSVYVSVEDKHILSEGGTNSFPYVVPRWTKRTDEEYGVSPAYNALPDIKMLQAMSMNMLELSQKIADPPLNVADDGVMLPLDAEAGGLIFGGIDPVTGRNRVSPIPFSGNPQLFEAILERTRNSVKNAFYANSLMSQNRPQMTAEEVVTLREENLRQIGPNAHRITQEGISPIIERTYALMEENDLFPELPKELKKFLKGKELKIEYLSPLARTAKSQDAMNINRYIQQAIIPLLQLNPESVDAVNFDRTLDLLAEGYGVPARALNTDEELEAIKQGRMQQQQQAMQLEMANMADQNKAKLLSATKGQQEPDPEDEVL